MDIIEAKGMVLVSEIDAIEREIKWHQRNDSCSSWECEKLEEELKDKERELRALGY